MINVQQNICLDQGDQLLRQDPSPPSRIDRSSIILGPLALRWDNICSPSKRRADRFKAAGQLEGIKAKASHFLAFYQRLPEGVEVCNSFRECWRSCIAV